MGTRHLIAAQVNGEYKLAQYGQWDGYPSGQGVKVLDFLKSKRNQTKLKKNLVDCTYIPEDELEANWDSILTEHPHISRDTGASILEYVAADSRKLRNSIEFAADGLFCEYAYVIDFDKNTLEIFQGFNKEPLDESERFASLPREPTDAGGSKYYGVKHVKTYDLTKLPTKHKFLTDLEHKEE